MKRIIGSTLISIVFISLCVAQDYDFRKSKWDDSLEVVKSSEDFEWIDPMEISNGVVALSSIVTLGGYDAVVAYYFIDNKLLSAKYIFAIEHAQKNAYIDDYEVLKNILISKYGKPSNKNDRYWVVDTWKNDPSYYGFALSMGDVSYSAFWTSPIVKIDMEAVDYQIMISISYESEDWEKKVDSALQVDF